MTTDQSKLSRRDLLKTIGVGGTAWVLGQASSVRGETPEGGSVSVGQPDAESTSPLNEPHGDLSEERHEQGMALCVSGGGYRAMLFHLGTIWRLNMAGLLPQLKRISSVSGGSITAGVLGYAWGSLIFKENVAQNFTEKVVVPIRKLAGETIDVGAVLKGIFLPGSITGKVRNAYEEYLFGDATLQDLPDAPRFVINATNVQTGSLWRFSKPYMADYRIGQVLNPTVSLATAVAASSAFPPVLSPLELELKPEQWVNPKGTTLHREPFTTKVILADGGVYDNLGLETVWKFSTVLVSDAGQKMEAEEDPATNWAGHSLRVLELIDNQVRSLRKRQIMKAFNDKKEGLKEGAYWGIQTDIREYAAENKFECPLERTHELARVPTRLKELEPVMQERLINWGFAVCDAAIRSYIQSSPKRPESLPYPGSPI